MGIYIELSLEKLIILHKAGNEEATICLLDFFDNLMNKYSRKNKTKEFDPDLKSEMIETCLSALNDFDVKRYL